MENQIKEKIQCRSCLYYRRDDEIEYCFIVPNNYGRFLPDSYYLDCEEYIKNNTNKNKKL